MLKIKNSKKVDWQYCQSTFLFFMRVGVILRITVCFESDFIFEATIFFKPHFEVCSPSIIKECVVKAIFKIIE